MDFKKLANQYRDELLDNVLPFWLEHSQDIEFGGYFSCLDREGKVFDTDKFIRLRHLIRYFFRSRKVPISGSKVPLGSVQT